MTKIDDTSPDLFADAGVGAGSGEGTAQAGGDPGETLPGSEPDEGDMDPSEDSDAAPGGDAPIAAASSSGVGHRDAGDTGDIGSTEGMTASFGGLAGTSR